MYFDRFDICEAWYLWLNENHGGQFSPEYGRLSRLLVNFTPAPGLCGREDLSENGQVIYDNISQ